MTACRRNVSWPMRWGSIFRPCRGTMVEQLARGLVGGEVGRGTYVLPRNFCRLALFADLADLLVAGSCHHNCRHWWTGRAVLRSAFTRDHPDLTPHLFS